MKRLRYCKHNWRWTTGIVFVSVCTGSIICSAAAYQNLREAKQAVWEEYLSEQKRLTEAEAFPAQEIDGAVEADGSVKMIIHDWDRQAIPAGNEAVQVYASESEKEYVGSLEATTLVSVLSEDTQYVRIQSGKLTGYVKREDLLFGEKAKEKADQICPAQVLTDKAETPIRVGKEKDSTVFSILEQRTTYQVLEAQDDWILIAFEQNFQGYVNAEDVKEIRKIPIGKMAGCETEPWEAYCVEEVTDQERMLLAAIIHCEAGGESFDGQCAVGSVVLNRLHDDEFPDTIQDVIYETKQFEPVGTGWYDEVLEHTELVSESCYEAADVVIQGQNHVEEALYFGQAGGGQRIGAHWFY